MTRAIVFAAVLIALAGPAAADPVTAAVTAVSGWFAALPVIGQALVRIAAGTLLSALTSAQQRDPVPKRGITTPVTLRGGDNSEVFVMGRAATGGMHVLVPPSHDKYNRLLTYVIDLGMAGISVRSVMIDGDNYDIQASAHPDYGNVLISDGPSEKSGDFGFNRAWIKTYEGGQTVADPMLLAKYGGVGDFPWAADMIGAGRSYAILTFYLDTAIFNGVPQVLFEVDGQPLYDPRSDSTMPGGSGAQRWADPATWAQTNNPAVMIYNILRGVTLPDGSTYGVGADADDLPIAEWAAAMNACDETVPVGAITQKRYRAGLEVKVADMEPREVVDKLLAACDGELVDDGGTWRIRIGAPALPVYFFDDGDVIVSSPQQYDPFPPSGEIANAAAVTYLDPNTNWETTEAKVVIDDDAVTADGVQRLVDLNYSCVFARAQARRLAHGVLKDNRRMRQHLISLPCDAAHVAPLETVAWTSARNGYTSKVFEIQRRQVNLVTLTSTVALRERDPGDYDLVDFTEETVAALPRASTPPALFVMSSLAATGIVIDGDNGTKRIAVRVTGIEDDVERVAFETALWSDLTTITGSGVSRVRGNTMVTSAGLAPGSTMGIRVRAEGDALVDWSAWLQFTTAASEVTPIDISGLVDATSFAAGIAPVEIVSSLPAAPHRAGRVVFLTTDSKIYRNTGSGWTAETNATDVVGQLTAGQIAAGAIGTDQLAANAIVASKLLVSDLSNIVPNPTLDAGADGWVLGAGASVETTLSGWNADRILRLTGAAGSFAVASSPVFKVTPGEVLWAQAQMQRLAGTGTVRADLMFSATSDMASPQFALIDTTSNTSQVTVDTHIAVPVGAFYARMRLFKQNDGTTDARAGAPVLRRATTGEMVVDGTLTAAKIDTRNLDIKDGAGNVIFSAGQDLSAARVAGLGGFATLDQITDVNVGTFIASAAIGNAQIANLNADKLTAGTVNTSLLSLDGLRLTNDGGALSITSGGVSTPYLGTDAATQLVRGQRAAWTMTRVDLASWLTVMSRSLTLSESGDFMAHCAFEATFPLVAGGGNHTVEARFLNDGVVVYERDYLVGDVGTRISDAFFTTKGASTAMSAELRLRAPIGMTGTSATMDRFDIAVLGRKR